VKTGRASGGEPDGGPIGRGPGSVAASLAKTFPSPPEMNVPAGHNNEKNRKIVKKVDFFFFSITFYEPISL